MKRKAILLLVALSLHARASLHSQASATLPDGEGRKEMQKVCGTCHPVEQVVASRRTAKGWDMSIEEMIARGAKGTDEELDKIAAYLTTNFGKLNVNTATGPEMAKALGLSDKEAQAIVAYRERNGKIKDFEELKKVPGVSAEKLQAKRGWIAFDR
jgi:competence protein ComEA